jgi:hypothetical protein
MESPFNIEVLGSSALPLMRAVQDPDWCPKAVYFHNGKVSRAICRVRVRREARGAKAWFQL